MKVRPLPPDVLALLQTNGAPPRLIAHLSLVHDVAVSLTHGITRTWSALPYDASAVLFGAATHDIGKTLHHVELSASGRRHEKAGRELLSSRGYPDRMTRYAETHGNWAEMPSPSVEDLLVALADTLWKGKRDEQLEGEICRRIATTCDLELWQVYTNLDDIVTQITADADWRLQWQNQFPA